MGYIVTARDNENYGACGVIHIHIQWLEFEINYQMQIIFRSDAVEQLFSKK